MLCFWLHNLIDFFFFIVSNVVIGVVHLTKYWNVTKIIIW